MPFDKVILFFSGSNSRECQELLEHRTTINLGSAAVTCAVRQDDDVTWIIDDHPWLGGIFHSDDIFT